MLYLNFESPMAFWMINRHMSNKQDESLYQGIYSQQDCVMITKWIANNFNLEIEMYQHAYKSKCFVVPKALLLKKVQNVYACCKITFYCDHQSSNVYSNMIIQLNDEKMHLNEPAEIDFIPCPR